MISAKCNIICKTLSVSRIYSNYPLLQNAFHRVPRLSSVRSFMSDPVSADNVLIYSGPLNTPVKLVKTLTLSTSFCGVCMQYMLFTQGTELIGDNVALKVAASGMLGFFTFVTPFIIHVITRKYVFRMYYNPITENYTAIMYTILLRFRLVVFKAKDAKIPDIRPLFTSVIINNESTKNRNVPLFFEYNSFIQMDHLKKILGYDKPINFDLDDDEQQEQIEDARKDASSDKNLKNKSVEEKNSKRSV